MIFINVERFGDLNPIILIVKVKSSYDIIYHLWWWWGGQYDDGDDDDDEYEYDDDA